MEGTTVLELRRRIIKRGGREQKQKKENMTTTQIQVHSSSVTLLLAR
jgi:hypothetical protein